MEGLLTGWLVCFPIMPWWGSGLPLRAHHVRLHTVALGRQHQYVHALSSLLVLVIVDAIDCQVCRGLRRTATLRAEID